MIAEGIYTDLSNEEYHGDKDTLSRSSLMDFDISPYTYWANHLNPKRPPKKSTPAMEFGTMVHTYLLEPDEFKKRYAILPPKVLLKNEGREKYEMYKAICEGMEKSGAIIIEQEDIETLLLIADRINANPIARDLIEGARIEHSYFWQDEHSGLMLKSRPDILHENMIVDLKTCSDASPIAYKNAMAQGGYHVQGAMTRDAIDRLEGKRINKVLNIVIENKYPHNIAIYIIDEYALDAGHMKYKQICLDLKAARESNHFEDFGIQTISLPKWAL